jgi:uncharacterized protein involved in response to NO
VLARPIVAAKSWRNVAFPPLLLLLAVVNAAMHGKALGLTPALGVRAPLLAVDLVLVFLVAVGTRVIPLFTANATPGLEVKRWALGDRAAPLLVLLLAIVHALELPPWASGAVALLAGLVVAGQMRGWGSLRTLDRPLLWVLHLGYLWLALGLLLLGVSGFTSALPRSAALHALTTGGLGTLVLGMMSRVSLGHTGRKLEVGPTITVAFVLLQLGALLRVVMAALGGRFVAEGAYLVGIAVSAALWSLAYALYLGVYLPILWGPRADGARDWRRAPDEA